MLLMYFEVSPSPQNSFRSKGKTKKARSQWIVLFMINGFYILEVIVETDSRSKVNAQVERVGLLINVTS